MTKALVLDDDKRRLNAFSWRFREFGWDYVLKETAADTIEALRNDKFDVVFLDHDLGDEQMCGSEREDTGAEVARWISQNPIKSIVVIHSYNPFGADYMKSLIPGSHRIPGIWEEKTFKTCFKEEKNGS